MKRQSISFAATKNKKNPIQQSRETEIIHKKNVQGVLLPK
jgi:hypothetical protein